MNIKENNGAIFLKFYGPIFSNCVSLEMLSKYNEIVFSFALLSVVGARTALVASPRGRYRVKARPRAAAAALGPHTEKAEAKVIFQSFLLKARWKKFFNIFISVISANYWKRQLSS